MNTRPHNFFNLSFNSNFNFLVNSNWKARHKARLRLKINAISLSVFFIFIFLNSTNFVWAQTSQLSGSNEGKVIPPPADIPVPMELQEIPSESKGMGGTASNHGTNSDLVNPTSPTNSPQNVPNSKGAKVPSSANSENPSTPLTPQNNVKTQNSKLSNKESLPTEGKSTGDFYGEKKDIYMKPSTSDEGYVYDPVGRRDPFRPYRDAKIGVGSLMGYFKERQPEPLEFFDAKSYQVVAIIWGIKKPKALLEDPNKKVHTVYKGMRIGKNDGVVAEIREGEIVVVEVFDYNGKLTKESYIMPIRK